MQPASTVLSASMADEPATVTYLIAEPFEHALRSIRKILSARHLNVTGGLDISARTRQKLFMGTAPCVVLYVSPPPSLSAALQGDPWAAALAPFHIVVSEQGRETAAHVLSALPGDGGSLAPPAVAGLNEAHSEMLRAIESIGMPAAMGV
jgi:uncharacterized protein (DUF302 family)